MAKSKQTTNALKTELARLASSGLEITQQAEKAWEELQKQPGSELLYRTYLDLMRQKRLIDCEIAKLERWLNPRRGRPRDPRYDDWINQREQARVSGNTVPLLRELVGIEQPAKNDPMDVSSYKDRIDRARDSFKKAKRVRKSSTPQGGRK